MRESIIPEQEKEKGSKNQKKFYDISQQDREPNLNGKISLILISKN
jgi:hypothetical protein